MSVGGFWKIYAPSRICSEHHPSLGSGENTPQQGYFSKNLMEIRRIVKKLKCFQNKIRIEIAQFPDENPCFQRLSIHFMKVSSSMYSVNQAD